MGVSARAVAGAWEHSGRSAAGPFDSVCSRSSELRHIAGYIGRHLVVWDSAFRFRICPQWKSWSPQGRLPADPGFSLGKAIAIDGDTAVVGAYLDGTGGKGAAYVFSRAAGVWTLQARLTVADPNERYLGYSVGVSGSTVAVGAGNVATYVFVRNGSAGTRQARLKGSNTESGDRLGTSVGISGDTIVAGAFSEDSQTRRVNGNQKDNSVESAGTAYVFAHEGAVWTQQAYLKASDAEKGDFFGWSVAVSGDTVVVGARLEQSTSGAAYFFKRGSGVWRSRALVLVQNSDSWQGGVFQRHSMGCAPGRRGGRSQFNHQPVAHLHGDLPRYQRTRNKKENHRQGDRPITVHCHICPFASLQ